MVRWMTRQSLRCVFVVAAMLGAVAGSTLGPGSGRVAAEDLAVPGADQKAGPARRTGGGFEFRRKLSSVDNPYCDIKTYVLPDFPEQASSTRSKRDRAVIVIDASTYKSDSAYAQFLMAHECCHHTLGHTRLTQQTARTVGVQPFFYVQPLLKNMELDADRCAVHYLKLRHASEAIESAQGHMRAFGDDQTGAYYPTGNERADNIARAMQENREEN